MLFSIYLTQALTSCVDNRCPLNYVARGHALAPRIFVSNWDTALLDLGATDWATNTDIAGCRIPSAAENVKSNRA